MFFVGQAGFVENEHWDLFRHHNCEKCQLGMMALLIKFYLFIPLSVTLTMLQGHSSVEQFSLKIWCSYPIRLKLCRIVK